MKKIFLSITILVFIVIFALALNQWFVLRRAHGTFDNYYAFRGCTRLLEKADSFGTCQTESGQIIKIVQFQNKWYLDGDLPWACLGSLCFGI